MKFLKNLRNYPSHYRLYNENGNIVIQKYADYSNNSFYYWETTCDPDYVVDAVIKESKRYTLKTTSDGNGLMFNASLFYYYIDKRDEYKGIRFNQNMDNFQHLYDKK